MTDKFAFVGDVHGNLDATIGMLTALAAHGSPHVVFLGDYINKGPQPAGVLKLLLEEQRHGHVKLLAGNHEIALLSALDTGDLTALLKMGGATTIRSYLRRPVRPDVLADFEEHLPADHLEGLRAMPLMWESDDLIAQHTPPDTADGRFQISAHIPVGVVPRITATAAKLGTGSGSAGAAGRLTALLWPSRNYLQVDAGGRMIEHG